MDIENLNKTVTICKNKEMTKSRVWYEQYGVIQYSTLDLETRVEEGHKQGNYSSKCRLCNPDKNDTVKPEADFECGWVDSHTDQVKSKKKLAPFECRRYGYSHTNQTCQAKGQTSRKCDKIGTFWMRMIWIQSHPSAMQS